MKVNDPVTERKKWVGGLHLDLRIGQAIEIEHNGEKIQLNYQGKNGTHEYTFSFNGPKSFKITRVERTAK